jgi:triosephosphate isomerase
MRQLIAGNWKMNGTRESLRELADLRVALAAKPPGADVLIWAGRTAAPNPQAPSREI